MFIDNACGVMGEMVEVMLDMLVFSSSRLRATGVLFTVTAYRVI
jgi:hypothetical protein